MTLLSPHSVSPHRPARRALPALTAVTLAAGLLVSPIAVGEAAATPGATIVDSPVNDVYDAQVGPDGTTYAVGDFSEVGAATGGMARLDLTDGDVDRTFPTVNGRVNAMVMDDDGNIYIAGDFVSVGGQPRANLARINADGSVDSWAPSLEGAASAGGPYADALAVSGDTLYVGGMFAAVDGQARTSLAAFDTVTGDLEAWAPNVVRTSYLPNVYALAADDTNLYVGGRFDTIDTVATTNLASFQLSDQSLRSTWLPAANDGVYAIEPRADAIYVGGNFTQIGGQNRDRLASLVPATGSATAWDPDMDGEVRVITIDDTVAYVGGTFSQANGNVSRQRVAALHTDDTGTLTAWNPGLTLNGNWVNDLIVTDTSLYVGSTILVRVSRAGQGTVDSQWQPRLPQSEHSPAKSILLDGSTLIAGGGFSHVNVVERNAAAAFDGAMRMTDWNPDIRISPNSGGTAYGIELAGSVAYIVGDFGLVNGSISRDYAVAVRTDDTGTATSWAPVFDQYAYDIELEGPLAYLAGDFGDINGETRASAASVRIDDTGTVTSWDPHIGGSAYSITVADGTAYVGGSYSDVKNGTVTRNNAAAFTTTGSGTVTSWAPEPNSDVFTIVIHGGVAYLGGGFDEINVWGASSVDRQGAASVSLDDSGDATTWDPQVDGDVNDLQVSGSYAYLSGGFDFVNGSIYRDALAAISIDDTGTVSDDWVPVSSDGFSYGNSYEGGLALAGGRLLVMSAFVMATLNGADYPGSMAALPVIASPSPDPTPVPVPAGSPRDAVAAAGDGRATVTWSAPASVGSFPVTNYQVTSSPGGRVCLTSTLSCEVTGLTNGTAYTFSVKALTGAGWSAWSSPSDPVTPTAMPRPTITITGSREGKRIAVTGATTGMGMGGLVTPWTSRIGRSVTPGKSVAVSIDGGFTWSRKANPRTTWRVYFTASDGIRSNTVVIVSPSAR